MRMSADWQDQGPANVVITPTGLGMARVFGLPFAAIGAYLLYQFVSGGVRGELTGAGWVLLPIVTAAFLVPGWLILAFRKRIHLDAGRREATEEFDFLIYRRRTTTALSAGGSVMLRFERLSQRSAQGPLLSTGATTYAIHVYLVADQRRNVLIALFGEKQKPEALAFAGKAAAFFGLEVQDQCHQGGEVNSAGVVVERLGPDEAD